jgi:hypothetical protein
VNIEIFEGVDQGLTMPGWIKVWVDNLKRRIESEKNKQQQVLETLEHFSI